MDPNTVDQVRIARYTRRVAALERDRTEGHQAYEHDHCEQWQQWERASEARRRTRFDASIDGHAHTLGERTYPRTPTVERRLNSSDLVEVVAQDLGTAGVAQF